jgi:glutamyl-tRNA synthetase
MSVVTRFAPSPTGYLHIGGARTALFNWLFTRHHGGRFLLRIEDTDRARSTPEAIEAILEGLRWLDILWDDEPVYQSRRADRHAAVAGQLLASGNAYRCFATAEELAEMRERARAEGRPLRYDGRWRDRDPATAPPGVAPVIRLKAPRKGSTTIADLVQGEVTVANEELDDLVLLRNDGTPTYNLAVVVDDHDMAITHVIRGDDHLTNAFRQYQIYRALDWPVPQFAHISLIHGTDGAKLSKRHGALSVGEYEKMGFLPEALCNYLLRLGWSHGDDEIISREQAVKWFDLDAVGRAPARFDMAKLTSLNAYYLRRAEDGRLTRMVLSRLSETLDGALAEDAGMRILAGMPGLKERAKTVVELYDNARIYALDGPPELAPAAAALLDATARSHLAALQGVFAKVDPWTAQSLETAVRDYTERNGGGSLKLKAVAQPLRAAVTGRTVSPPIFEVMAILGRQETLRRLSGVLSEALGTD